MYEKVASFLSACSRNRFGGLLLAVLAASSGSALAGCQPQIGDKCVLNTDCSSSGTRQCDDSMPGGYCTMYSCGPNTCPDQSACYLFYADVQGCTYSDRAPSRTAHTFCMKDCSSNGDCRSGYECRDLRFAPWNAILLDDNQNQHVCIPIAEDGGAFFSAGEVPDADLPICQTAPDIDAAFPTGTDAGVADAGLDASDGAPADAGFDATLDAGIDATLPSDAGASDAGAPDAAAPDAATGSEDAASDAALD